MPIKLSIVTVCYNEKDVERTCLSILNQTWQNFEWIVVDGGSDSWCTAILEKYRDRMAFYVSEKDSGIYNAMNKGISQAKGEYILFMNAGDSFFGSNTLEKVNTHFHKKADVFYGDTVLKMGENEYKYELLPHEIDDSFLIENCLTHQASYIRTDLFKTYGNYNEKYKIVSDLEKWIQFMQAGCSFEHLPFLCAIFNKDGISSEMDEKHLAERANLLQKYFSANSEAKTVASYHPINPYAQSTTSKIIPITQEYHAPKQPDISVIVPVFNMSLYLEDCLNSLLAQTHQNLEIICVNDASYDNSLDILRESAKKDARIRIYSFEENVGVAACRNLGLAKAHGEYIGFVDSDDWIDLDFYEKLFNQAKKGNYDLVKGGVYRSYENGTRTLSPCNTQTKTSLKQNKLLAMAVRDEFWAHLYRNTFLQNIHAEFPRIANGEDTVFLLKVLLHNPTFSIIDDAFYYYRQRQNSVNHSYSTLNIQSTFDATKMQCALIDASQLSQSQYMDFYYSEIYGTILTYYQKIMFVGITSQDSLLCLQLIFELIKEHKYLDLFLEHPSRIFLKKYIAAGSIAQSELLLFLKELLIGQRNFTISYYKYKLRYKLSRGKKRPYYKHKYLLCEKIEQLRQKLATEDKDTKYKI